MILSSQSLPSIFPSSPTARWWSRYCYQSLILYPSPLLPPSLQVNQYGPRIRPSTRWRRDQKSGRSGWIFLLLQLPQSTALSHSSLQELFRRYFLHESKLPSYEVTSPMSEWHRYGIYGQKFRFLRHPVLLRETKSTGFSLPISVNEIHCRQFGAHCCIVHCHFDRLCS